MMRRLFLSSPLAALLLISVALLAVAPRGRSAPTAGGSTLPAAEWKAIKTAKAFTHAAPGIRAQFGNPENFLAMVQSAYVPLVTARYTEFLEGAVIDGNVIQPLRLVAADNTVQVALYTMQKQKDGRWKISGCVLAPSTVQAA